MMAFPLLLFVVAFLTRALPGAAQWSQTVSNGLYYGTQVGIPNPRPTLTYNCALLPSICQNVQNWINQDPVNRALPRTFHVDPNSQRLDRRRANSCPSDWSDNHDCPEILQDPIRAWVRTPRLLKDTWAFPSTQLLPRPANSGSGSGVPGAGFKYEIAAANLVDSAGLAYTCDEFPPASWIEGGSDLNGNSATTICAPHGISCSSKEWKIVKSLYNGVPGTEYPSARSEQDWQATSHSHLSGYARRNLPGQIMQFEFRTTSVAPGISPNAATIRLPGQTITVTKRGVAAVETFSHALPTPLARSGVHIELIEEIEVSEIHEFAAPTPTSSPDHGKREMVIEHGFNLVCPVSASIPEPKTPI
ncbi:uncharacterized protein EI97DRAFT_504490 [Westerdykella ornata]|uniref:Uncharacterized protein n=1 Tax=Westerdykella ornata TaxID=318751 RepID=A0A6A6J7D4_WESOR|nr:uncharacterized protein EI97DRAFT_504490 [Westerdykella ornata]KAF2272063.1 hypothetical protein EI97DRAFT_504490 [Westerdykella ornata]